MPVTAYISLGSNIGDRRANLNHAMERLKSLGDVTKVSSFYETEPVEYTEQDWFLNAAAELRTELSADELMRKLLEIERSLGRTRVHPTAGGQRIKGPRTLDLDMLLYGDTVRDTPMLHVPHPAMHLRRFVLVPLAEIAPEVIHPVLKRSIRELLASLPAETGEVRISSER